MLYSTWVSDGLCEITAWREIEGHDEGGEGFGRKIQKKNVYVCVRMHVCVCVFVIPQRVLYRLSVYELNNASGDSLPLSLLFHFLPLSPSPVLTSSLSIIHLFF